MENYVVIFISGGKLTREQVEADSKYEAIDNLRERVPVDGTNWVVYDPDELDGYTYISLDGGASMARVKRDIEETLCAALWYVSEEDRPREREARREAINKQLLELSSYYVGADLHLHAMRGLHAVT